MAAIHRAITTKSERKAFGLPWGIKGLTILCGNKRFVSASSQDNFVTCKGCLRKMKE